MHHLAVLDVETTGLFPEKHDRVVEVAVVELTPDLNVAREYATLVNPSRDLGPTSIHGVRGRDVKAAPRFEEIADDLVEHLAGRVIVGHNVRFDLRFLAAELGRLGLALPSGLSIVDTMHLVGGLSLAEACARFGIDLTHAHCALDDALATARLLRTLNVAAPQQPPPPTSAWPRLAYVPTEYRRPERQNESAEQERPPIAIVKGMSVCFTGESALSVGGELLSRDRVQQLAELAGLIVCERVTKKLNLLVTADPDSLSGKAKKARDYGIPIAEEKSFWRTLGLRFESI